jgi:hypothetical protein
MTPPASDAIIAGDNELQSNNGIGESKENVHGEMGEEKEKGKEDEDEDGDEGDSSEESEKDEVESRDPIQPSSDGR